MKAFKHIASAIILSSISTYAIGGDLGVCFKNEAREEHHFLYSKTQKTLQPGEVLCLRFPILAGKKYDFMVSVDEYEHRVLACNPSPQKNCNPVPKLWFVVSNEESPNPIIGEKPIWKEATNWHIGWLCDGPERKMALGDDEGLCQTFKIIDR